MQKQRLQVFPKDDGKLNNVQKKGLSILLWVKRERRYTTAVTVRPEAEKTWTGDAAADDITQRGAAAAVAADGIAARRGSAAARARRFCSAKARGNCGLLY